MLDELLKSLTHAELRFIAKSDYGVNADVHLEALKQLIASQDRVPTRGQHWYPYEVIELCASSLTPGHEREFTACTLLVLHAVASGYDTSTWVDEKLADRAKNYDALPVEFRDAILDAYQRIEQ
ncbi:hypothetical protein [Pseudomonas sp. CGJS7]|uniref:hypothetical protein n=1 Tax=Pseudomonas sp. CGJS7 TaxID=3109348 RepID=UPI003008EDA6